MIDTWAPFYQDQMAFIRQLSFSIPADVELVVKLHFSDPYNYSYFELQELLRRYHVSVASPFVPSRPFLERASLVVGITGTSNFEAAVRGKPVLLFGNSPFQHFPRTERALTPDKVFKQIKQMLNMSRPGEDEIVEAVANYMSRYMPGQVNDWSIPYELVEHDKYADCFLALATYVETTGITENWYKQSPFI
jgi:capsule polysaccharide modification protein KpsS